MDSYSGLSVRGGAFLILLFELSVGSWAASGDARLCDGEIVSRYWIGSAAGQPVGLTGKYWLTPHMAGDLFLGYHFENRGVFHADILYHVSSQAHLLGSGNPFYFGLGMRQEFPGHAFSGLRLPLGISTAGFPLGDCEFFVEVAPISEHSMSTWSVDGMTGLRIDFGRASEANSLHFNGNGK